MSTRLLGALAVAASLLVVPAGRAGAASVGASVPDPTVSLPPAGLHKHALFDSYYDLAPFGYVEQEYFVSGVASAGGASAPYTTRVIVARPASAAAFNGTVLLDWVNVTAQFEIPVDSMEARQMLMREGFAYVYVSAQSVGVCCTPLTPKVWDPIRYKALKHPGDQYANSMFSQIAKAVRVPVHGPAMLGDLPVARVLAAGQSQSADKLYDYVNNEQPRAGVIDGFLIHGGGRKTFPAPLTAKVLNLSSDEEADNAPLNPAEPNYRLWEVAGTAHSDFFIGYQSEVGNGPRTLADRPRLTEAQYNNLINVAGNYGEQLHPLLAACILAGATMPMHYAESAAIHQLDAWVHTGAAPANSPRFTFAGTKVAQDDVGNTLGGIRLPPIEVPVARYVSTACGLGGFTVPMTNLQIQARYPTFSGYYARMAAATNRAVSAGWMLPADAVDQMRRVCAAKNRWGLPPTVSCAAYQPPAFNAAA